MPSTYRELDFDRLEFRLLELHLNPSDGSICYSLRYEFLTEPPSYVALSHHSSDEFHTEYFYLDGICHAMTANLQAALRHCLQAGINLIWVHEICINWFERSKEQSPHIRYASLIYSQAEYTVSWVGNWPGTRPAEAIEFFEQLRRQLEISHLSPDDMINEQKSKQIKSRRIFGRANLLKLQFWRFKAWLQEDQNMTWLATGCQLTIDLLRCEYWKRRWIIQEIAVSREVHVVYQSSKIQFDDLAKMIELCELLDIWSAEFEAVYEYFRIIRDLRRRYQSDVNPMFFDTLMQTSNFISRDIRDRVFSLWAFCADSEKFLPTPSYTQPLSLITRDVTRALIQSGLPLDIILPDPSYKPTNYQNLGPTWTGDWLTRSSDFVVDARRAKKLTHQDCRLQTLSTHSNAIKLRSVPLGKVIYLTSVLTWETSSFDDSFFGRGVPVGHIVVQYYKRNIRYALATCLVSKNWSPIHQWSGKGANAVQMFAHCIRGRSWLAKTKLQQSSSNSTKHLIDYYIAWFQHNDSLMQLSKDVGFHQGWAVYHYYYTMFRDLGLFFAIVAILYAAVMGFSFSNAGLHTVSTVKRVYIVSLMTWFVGVWLFTSLLFFILEYRQRISESDLIAALKKPHRFFVCDSGVVGITCLNTRLGDQITLLDGCENGAVLRKIHPDDTSRMNVIGMSKPCLSSQDADKFLILSSHDGQTNDVKKSVAEARERLIKSMSDHTSSWWEEVELY